MYAGHYGHCKMLGLLKQKFWWPRMSTDVQKYTKSCKTCKQAKPTCHLPNGQLQPLLLPKGPQQDWTMDFITELSPSTRRSSVYNTILVVVDRYIKYARYIPAWKNWDAKLFADIIVKEVFIKFGMPRSITSNQSSLFKSNFWSDFCYYIRICLGYSTAIHPQTNGQIECQNQTLEQYLKSYVNYQQDN